MSNPPVSLTFSHGIDNLSPETKLDAGYLRDSVNLDGYPSGALRTRPGVRSVISGAIHSLHTPSHGLGLLMVRNGALVWFDGTNTATVVAAVGPAVSYADLQGATFWSDGTRLGRVLSNGSAAVWGLATPPSIHASAVASGGLTAGAYQVTQTATVDGLESGAAEPVIVTVPENGGIQVIVPTGADFNVYRTPANGKSIELCLAAQLSSGASTVLGSDVPGRSLKSLRASPPPATRLLTAYRGRIFGANGSLLWFTSELSAHWVIPDHGYFRFESSIVMLGVAEDGLYVGTDDCTWFLSGTDPADMRLQRVANVGAGSLAISLRPDAFLEGQSTAGAQCAWVDSDGFLCIGKAGGILLRPHRNRFCMGHLNGAALAEVRRAGLRQILVSMTGRNDTVFIQNDPAIEAVFTNGVELNA